MMSHLSLARTQEEFHLNERDQVIIQILLPLIMQYDVLQITITGSINI